MRVLLATYWELPYTGGIWTYIKILKEHLEKKGHDVDIIASYPGSYNQYYLLYQPSYIRVEGVKNLVKPIINTLFKTPPGVSITAMEVKRYSLELAASSIGLNKYDVIHAHDVISTRALSRVKPKHIPLVATLHGCLTSELIHSGVIKERSSISKYFEILEYIGALSSDKTILPSKWLKSTLSENYHVPEDHISVLPNGIDIDSFQKRMNMNPSIQKPANKKLITCIARLTPIKGHQLLLDALAKLKTDREDWICWLVGDGELKDKLKQQIRYLGLDDFISILGEKTDVPPLLKQTDIFVLPSLQENLPFTVMEAQLSNTAVIVSNVGSLPEMVRDGETGLVFSKGSIDELYLNLRDLVEDSSLTKFLSRNGKIFGITNWSIDRMMIQIEEFYQKEPIKQHHLINNWENHINSNYLNKKTIIKVLSKANNPMDEISRNLPNDYIIPDPLIINLFSKNDYL